jgi:two-component system OmpR family sensor kinase
LRTRLLVLLIALLAAVSATIVGVSALVLRSYLIHQVDDRVLAVDNRWPKPPPGPGIQASASNGCSLAGAGGNTALGIPSPSGPALGGSTVRPAWEGTPAEFLCQRGLPSGLVAAQVVDGKIENADILEVGGTPSPLSASVAAKLATVPVDDEPRTITLGGLGEYRVTARLVPDGSTVVSGLPLKEVNATVYQLILVGGCVASCGVLLLGIVGAVTVRRTLRPLRRVAAAAARVAELPLDRGEVTLRVRVPEVDTDPRTEVGRVGAALNHMLGHVGAALTARHASETRVRQFVADASHELRTPLAAISGYVQLTRRIGDVGPPDVAYALSRVESETKRMTALVEDMLLLARLDSGRPLDHGCVDLSRLVVDVVSDAHIAAPGHHFTLSLPAEPVIVTGDQARLHQVLANLLANARTHTPTGTSVTVALETAVAPPVAPKSTTGPESAEAPKSGNGTPTPGEIRISVADDGPGIPEELLPNIFERFARGDSSRSRAGGSTGLGLAIVAAVAEAHGGKITVASVPGNTVFTVVLPGSVPAAEPTLEGSVGDLATADVLDSKNAFAALFDQYAAHEGPASDVLAGDGQYAPPEAAAADVVATDRPNARLVDQGRAGPAGDLAAVGTPRPSRAVDPGWAGSTGRG